VRHVKYPIPFYFSLGMLIGLLLVPKMLSAFESIIEKRAEFVITPKILAGFVGPSTKEQGNVEWISLVISIGNEGLAASSADKWQAILQTPDGHRYEGLIKEITGPVCLGTANLKWTACRVGASTSTIA